MKKVAIVVSLVAVLLIAGTAIAALPGSGWATNVQIQNVGSAVANVNVSSYSGGAVVASSPFTVPVGGSKTILASDMGIGTGYQGAGVLSSDQPLFGILFVTNFGTGAGNTASAIVRAVNAENTATSMSFPLAKQNFGSGKKTTTFYIQNAGSATANISVTMATLSGSCAGPNPKTYSNIVVNEQVNFTPADLGCVDGTYGSISVVSTNGQALAGVVLEHDNSAASPAGGSRVVQGTRGFAPADGDTRLIAPIIKKSYGQNKNVTGLQVQNVSGATIPAGGLVVTYTVVAGPMGAGTVVTETNTSAIADKASFNSLHPTLLAGTLASAEVAVSDPYKIVGIVNENRPAGTTVFRNTTYSLLAAHDAATSVSLPLVKEFFGASGGRCTGVQVVPVGGNAILELTYKATTGQQFVVTTSAATGTKTFVYVSNGVTGATVTGGTFADMKTKNYGVTVKSLTAGVKVVAVANESFCPGAARDEDDANYEGFALP